MFQGKQLLKFSFYFSLIFFFLAPTKVFAFDEVLKKIKEAKYIFCIDAGASQSKLKVLGEDGDDLLLFTPDKPNGTYSVSGDCANITAYSNEHVEKAFLSLIDQTLIGKEKIPAKDVLSQAALVGGFGGAGRESGKKALQEILEKIGFAKSKMAIYSDAGLATELASQKGGILISGTGSICFTRNEGRQQRYGGLGYRLNDEGSGYLMGVRAIKAAIESELDDKEQTTLIEPIKKIFGVKSTINLIESINKGQEPPSKIASVAKVVFEKASEGDKKSQKIIAQSAEELGELLAKAIKNSDLKSSNFYLIGGLFQSETPPDFVLMVNDSKALSALDLDQKPLLINLSKEMIPEMVVQEALLSQDKFYKPLSSLPITKKASCKKFKEKYRLGFVSTEKKNQKFKNLSQIFQKNQLEGLEAMQLLDQSVLTGTEEFVDHYLEDVLTEFVKTIEGGGRIFFLGSGSSGRIALDLSAKWRDFFSHNLSHLPSSYKDSVRGVIAGGPSSFVKAREKFEDSIKSGKDALKEVQFNSKDLAVFISASGSAHFNVGAAHYAHDCGGKSYYLYNSKQVPERTQLLFDQKVSKPLLIDIGPQTITGSTRLQASSLDELCLGIALESIIEKLTYGEGLNVKNLGHKIIQNLQTAWDSVSQNLPQISKIIDLEVDVFSNPEANFWRTHDETQKGFVTFLAAKDSLREIMIDATETAPTFSTNPPRYDKYEYGKKKAEFRAFLSSNQSNINAWEELMGQPIDSPYKEFLQNLLLTSTASGYGSYKDRTGSEGNLLIGVLKSTQNRENALELISEMRLAKYRGLKLAAILLQERKSSFEKEAKQLEQLSDACVHLKKIPKDYLGLTTSLALKQTLNLISNASMIKMNKVYGNTMIDLFPSNNKLIDRSIRIVQEIYAEHHPDETQPSYELLYQYVTRAYDYKKIMETFYQEYVPSCTKLVLTMLEKNYMVDDAIKFLSENNENIHKLYEM